MRHQQAELFLWFIGLGVAGSLIYDLIRAFRNEIRHGRFMTMAEDLLFCAMLCSGCFGIFLWKNQGALRFYGFLGILTGALLYYCTISRWTVRFFRWCFRIIQWPFGYVFQKCKKWKIARKTLTNRKG